MMHRSNLPIQNMKTLCKHVHILRKCSINARAPGGTESMRVVQGSTVAAVPILILLSRTVLPMPHTMVSGKKESAAQSSNESCVSQESAVPPPPPGPPLGWNESAADDLQDATHVPYTRCQAKDCSCGPWERCLVGTTDWRDCLWRRSRRCMRSPPKSNVRLAHLRLVRRKLGSWREIPISTPMGVLASQSGAFSFLAGVRGQNVHHCRLGWSSASANAALKRACPSSPSQLPLPFRPTALPSSSHNPPLLFPQSSRWLIYDNISILYT
jgi:hypothetical protein